ncbi:hypothetical protein Lepto7375DRAFT_8254 [Leptolyngbya sp. PCC 7375]|nr:hypothetical protein Lepto7375DRAFT_8254 [Leptolyngbya sp. PCC 7375]
MWPTSRKHILIEQMNACETYLQSLIEDYSSLSNQLASESNEKTKNGIKRQLKDLEREIDEAGHKRDRFAAKIQHIESKQTQFTPPDIPPTPPRPDKNYPPAQPPSEPRKTTPKWLRKYLPAVGVAVGMLFIWHLLADNGMSLHHEFRSNPDAYRTQLALHGLLGGLISGLLLFSVTQLRSSSQRLFIRANLSRAITYCISGASLGTIIWYVTESIAQSQRNPSYYGQGAYPGAIICMVLSLVFLMLLYFQASLAKGRRRSP